MTTLAHLLAGLLLVGFPAYVAAADRVFVRALRRGDLSARSRDYHRTMVALVGLSCLALAAGDPAGLGLTLPVGWPSIAGAALTAVILGVLHLQRRAIARMEPGERETLAVQFAAVADFMPHTRREYRSFRALSVTAGVCEELLYRGFLLGYLTHLVGVGMAVLLGALGFGLLHGYKAPAGVVRSAVAGALFGALYLTSGSLLWPVLVHIAVDLHGGAVAWSLRRT